ncbi:MAG: Yip1 family protein [Methylophilaceae bacterium]
MNPLTLFKLFFTPTTGWNALVKSRPSIHGLYLLHVIPFALLASVMLYFSASSHGGVLGIFPGKKLALVAIAFFLVQLIAVPAMAVIIRQLGEIADTQASFKDSFILAAVAPTPLWFLPIILVVPNTLVLLAALVLALLASAGFIYYGVPAVFKIKEQGHAILYFGGILIAGVVAAGFLMICTLIIWSAVQGLQFAPKLAGL